MAYLTAVADEDDVAEATDEAIVVRVVAGDTAAFETLVRRHNRRVFRATRAILKTDDEAEDAMQEAYVSAFSHLKDFGGRARFATWLVRIAVYEALGRLRRGKHVTTTSLDDTDFFEREEEPMATSRSPEEEVSDQELRALLERAVDELPIAFRTVFVMCAVEGMTADETAEALDVPAETVRTRLHRARGLLRHDLARRIENVAPSAFEFHLSRCDRIASAVLRRVGQR